MQSGSRESYTAGFVTVAASRALTPSDFDKTLLCTVALTLTVPTGLGSYFVCRVRQLTAAQTTIAAGAGMAINAPFGVLTGGNAGQSLVIEVDGLNNRFWVE